MLYTHIYICMYVYISSSRDASSNFDSQPLYNVRICIRIYLFVYTYIKTFNSMGPSA